MKRKAKERCVQAGASSETLSQLCIELSSKSFDMAEGRYQSLLSATSHLMTCISIVSVALFSVLPVLLDVMPGRVRFIAGSYIVVFALLVAALVLVLVARYRFPYDIMKSPQELVDYTVSCRQEFEDGIEVGQFFGRCLEGPYTSIQTRIDRISRLVKWSFGLLIFCLILTYILFVLIVCI